MSSFRLCSISGAIVAAALLVMSTSIQAATVLYAAGVNHGLVSTITPTGDVSTFKSGLGGLPAGMDFDPSGNLYLMNFGSPAVIQKITPSGTVSTFATGFNDYSPRGLTYNPADNTFYVFDYGQDKVWKVSSSGTVSAFATVPGATNGIFVGSDLYVTDNNNGLVHKVTSSGTVSIFASGLSGNPFGIAYDGSDFYVTGYNGGGFLHKVDPSGNVSMVTTGLGSSTDIVYNPDSGDFLIADASGSRILNVTHSGVVTTYASGVPSPYELRLGNAVPEPTTLGLLGLGSVIVLRRRRSCSKSL